MRITLRLALLTALLIACCLPAYAETFTIAVVPDTQQEITGNPARFSARMQWLADHKTELNLQMVLHSGDLANWDTPDHKQFVIASEGMDILNKAGIPFAIALGNHDTAAVREGGSAAPGKTNTNLRITPTFNTYFPPSRFTKFSGSYEPGKMDNAYHIFTAGGLNWLVINLELWPRTQIVDWAKTVVQDHPHHNVIILTHSHLTAKSTIEPTNGGYGDNSPQFVFNNLMKPYANVRLVFSGHIGSHGYRTDPGASGNTVYQFLQCYHDNQANPTRLLEIDTTNRTIKSRVYCPSTGKDKTDGSTFTVTNVNWVAAE
jgi:hypothetical protein